MIPVPDLLHQEPRLDIDHEQLHELFGLAFTGRGDAPGIDRALTGSLPEGPWKAEQFARDLFVKELIEAHLSIEIEGRKYSTRQEFMWRTLTAPPLDMATIEFRQRILREMSENGELLEHCNHLYQQLFDLINMFRVPGSQARLDINLFRLDLFRLFRDVVEYMVSNFEASTSGLSRLHTVARELQASEEYRMLATLLDYDNERASLNLDLKVGANGRITELRVREVQENRQNPFFQSAWQRWVQKTKALLWFGFRLHDDEIVGRLVQGIYDRIATPLMTLGQLLGHLEIYLAQHQLRQRLASAGLEVCLAELQEAGMSRLEGLFNPLLLSHAKAPVPCDITQLQARCTTLITGPNSGGKTRLLQAVGLAQLLGQGGFYVAASSARLVLAKGMFVSLIEHEAIEHSEGRLGRELERIRAMFDAIETPSMVILDELCSGTNPSEGIEVFSLVLRLLEKVRPMAYITTHFLDFARQLEEQPPVADLRFLQVDFDEQKRSTYQFVPGVAKTSLAAVMAERMGVTFDRIATELDSKPEIAIPERKLA